MRLTIVGSAAAILALVSCSAVGPDYHPPSLPNGVDSAAAAPFVDANAPGISQAPLPPDWWRLYDDAVLDQLIGKALAANTDLRVAAANLERARAEQNEVRSAAGVQTTIGSSVSIGETAANGLAVPRRTQAIYDVGIGISYEIDVVGRIRRALEAARADTGAVAAAYDLARITVVANVVDAYVQACSAGAQLQVAYHSINLQEQSLRLLKRGIQGGVNAPADAVRSQTLLDQLRASVAPFEGERKVAAYRLAVLTGQAPAIALAPVADCARIPRPAVLIPVGNGMTLLNRRPDVRAAERRLAAATASIGIAVADLYPSVSLGASVGATANSGDKLLDDSALHFSIGPLISWRFPNTSVARARIAQAKASTNAALASYDGVVLGALQEAETALTLYAHELERNAELRHARDDSAAAVRLQRRQTAAGIASSLAVLDAERTLASAENDLAASNAALASQIVRIFLALGGGWESSPAVQP